MPPCVAADRRPKTNSTALKGVPPLLALVLLLCETTCCLPAPAQHQKGSRASAASSRQPSSPNQAKSASPRQTSPPNQAKSATPARVNSQETRLKVWKLKQTGDILGERYIYVCKEGFKIFYPKAHYAITSGPPDWKVTFYNVDRKSIYSTTMDGWQKSLNIRSKAAAQIFFPDKFELKPGKPKLVAGEIADCLLFKSKQKVDLDSIYMSEFYLSNRIEVPIEMQKFFAYSWGKDVSRRQPLRIVLILGNGYRSTKIDTEKVERELLPADFFQPPQNYKPAKNADEVILGTGLINDIVDDLGKQLGTGR
ncbi:MAG: hypothetical protein IPK73_08595 [Candidatus Obscuribacter sp.]|nr:hypothetical protein [Candidatus Obscuribacter sp.]MBK9279662.1 hypothetical protein [Candidatus Obscuribacter sp.]MBL8086120.1 hypothetical protein [Candidatus Obscuribacter sp.]